MAGLYLDEDQPVSMAADLRQRGHDVVHAYDWGNHGVPDAEQLRIAAAAGRILVTYNRRDFAALHRLWLALNCWEVMARHHAGILAPWGQIPPEPWAEILDNFLASGSGAVMENRMWEWRRQQREWIRAD